MEVLGESNAQRITAMVTDLIATSAQADSIGMSPEVWDAMMALRAFLFEEVYLSERAKAEASWFCSRHICATSWAAVPSSA